MKEKIKFLLQAIARDVTIRGVTEQSSQLDRCEFWFDADYIPFGIIDQIHALSYELEIGVIGFNNGLYYITVYGISAKS